MPIYAYACASCGHAKDVLQKMSDPPLTECPACGAAAFGKQVTAAGFQLKGSGWYVTDFRDGAEAEPARPTAPSRRRKPTRAPAAPTQRPAAASRRPRRDAEPGDAAPPPAPGAPAPAAARSLRRPLSGAPSRRAEPRCEKVPDRRPAGLAAAGHHDLGAEVGARHAGRRVRLAAEPARRRCCPRRRARHRDAAQRAGPRRAADAGRACWLTGVFASQHRRPVVRCARATGCCTSIPVVKSIYSSVKQVSDTLFSSSGNAFRKAVLVQYPRAGLVDHRLPHRHARRRGRRRTCAGDYVSVYVPTTPNPTVGYFLMMPRSRRDRARHERRRGAEVHHLDGRGRAAAQRRVTPRHASPAERRHALSALTRHVADRHRQTSAPDHGRCAPTTAASSPKPLLGQTVTLCGWVASPPRPRRRDLHRPARPRRPGAGRLRSRPRRDVRDRRDAAQRVLPAGHRQGARAPGRHGERQPDDAARSRCWRTSSRC